MGPLSGEQPVNELDEWVAAASAELGLQPGDVSTRAVLDVARDVAHQVLRPGAPVTAYLMGVAVGRGDDPADVAARISALALAWPSRDGGPATSDHEPASSDDRPAASGPAGAETADGKKTPGS